MYSVSRWAGRKPASRMMRRNSSSVVQLRTPAARTTFSSIITEPTSLPPKRKPVWQTFSPCVTQLDWTFSKLLRIDASDGQRLQVFDGGGFVPSTTAQSRVLRLKRPRDERGEAACLFLQIVDSLEMIDAVLVGFTHAEHHGRGGSHAELCAVR